MVPAGIATWRQQLRQTVAGKADGNKDEQGGSTNRKGQEFRSRLNDGSTTGVERRVPQKYTAALWSPCRPGSQLHLGYRFIRSSVRTYTHETSHGSFTFTKRFASKLQLKFDHDATAKYPFVLCLQCLVMQKIHTQHDLQGEMLYFPKDVQQSSD